MKTIAIIGASKERAKFGNKCVRAYLSKDYKVFPVNPKEEKIEGLDCYKSISDIKEKINIVSIYLHPIYTEKILDDIIKSKPKVIYLNPGTESVKILQRLQKTKIKVKEECSIVAIGLSPYQFP